MQTATTTNNNIDIARIVSAVTSEINFPIDGDFNDPWNRAWASFPSHGVVQYYEHSGLMAHEDPDHFAEFMLNTLYEDSVIELEEKIDSHSLLEDQSDEENIDWGRIYQAILQSIHQADREELRREFRRFAVESG
ncbi:hypothetical protein [Salinisphaera hydrothermalis]|uniref:hypothetical protein n=1 Tax=Salinisphaera hydrothermalis TaxID=563188 RepID=UPI0033404211